MASRINIHKKQLYCNEKKTRDCCNLFDLLKLEINIIVFVFLENIYIKCHLRI